MRRFLSPLMLSLSLCACSAPVKVEGEDWGEANALFHGDARFIGGDGAVTVDLGAGRFLWLFGDSFIATSEARVRARSIMVRNCVALQTGADPTQAFMKFYWGGQPGSPTSYFPEDGDRWFWPGQGMRLGHKVLLFYGRVKRTGDGMWGFGSEGWTATLAGDVDQEPSTWTFETVSLPADSHGVDVGGAVLDDGNGHLVAYGIKGDTHSVYAVRWSLEDASRGDLSQAQWWCGPLKHWDSSCEPAVLMRIGAPEFSVQRIPKMDAYVWMESNGFGATRLAYRTARQPEGPWNPPRTFYKPPESDEKEAFVYAGKAHPGMAGADLVVTYVPSSFVDRPSEEGRLYYPHFVKVNVRVLP